MLDYRVLRKHIKGFSILKIHIVVDITNIIITIDIYWIILYLGRPYLKEEIDESIQNEMEF